MRRLQILLLLLLAFASCGCSARSEEIVFETETESEVISDGSAQAPEEDAAFEICVDVAGAVNSPGVVRVPAGARVYEAIVEAGGFSDDAATEFLNQAARLEDGQQIRVYTRSEAQELALPEEAVPEGTSGAPAADGKININTATAEELMTLSGIGEARAADIIRYREENGGFQSIEEIMNVSGIKDAVFGKIKDRIVAQ